VRLAGPVSLSEQASASQYALLDVGEGCVGRLRLLASVYEPDNAGNECRNAAYHKLLLGLKLIWVSHMHADHHTGLLCLLSHFAEALNCSHCCKQMHPPLDVVGPPALKDLLHVYQNTINGSMPFSPRAFRYIFVGGTAPLQQMWGLAALVSVRVDHCRDSFGAILTIKCPNPAEYLALVYSGDTRPCQAIVSAVTHTVQTCGGMCTVILIHEATMNDDRADDAHRKKHSTVGGAVGVATRMAEAVHMAGGRFLGTVLTHFSQRYPSIPCARSETNNHASARQSATPMHSRRILVPTTKQETGTEQAHAAAPVTHTCSDEAKTSTSDTQTNSTSQACRHCDEASATPCHQQKQEECAHANTPAETASQETSQEKAGMPR
jgi:ribonuclease BN (tRNA processing enzyme)